MSPRRPHLRDRTKLQTPSRYKDDGYVNSPLRQVSYEESRESSDLEEEIYESPKPKKSKTKRPVFRGNVTEFNPNLPPAAFPTLDHPGYVHNGGHIAIDLSGPQSQEPKNNTITSGRSCLPEMIGLTEGSIIKPTSANSTCRDSRNAKQTSMTVSEQSQDTMLSSMYGEVTDNGPRNPIWTSNMARMAAAGRMSDSDRLMLEMESSDEEDAATNPTERARKAGVTEVPAWDDLTVAHKLNLTDTIAELYPDLAQVMHQLRLDASQKKELIELLSQRSDREAREEANQQRLQERTKDALLSGKPFSQSAFHQILNETLYENIGEEDHLQTNLMELKKARRYLRSCAPADSSWDIHSASNSASVIRVENELEENQIVPEHSKKSLSQGPAVSALSQDTSNSTRSCAEPFGRQTLRQPRVTPAHAPIRQYSPPAPLSKVPSRSFRIAPSSRCNDLHVKHHGTTLPPQPSLPAGQEQPNVLTGVNRRALINALSNTSGTSSVFSNPPEKQSLLEKSRPLAPKDLSTMREDYKRQISASLNAGSITPQKKWVSGQ